MDRKVQVTFCILVTLMIAVNMGYGQGSSGACICGGFSNLEHLDEPIFQQALPNVKALCNEHGKVYCQQKCKRIVKAIPVEVAIDILCLKLNKTIDIAEMHLFSKNCDTGDWMSTEENLPKSICCRDKKSVPCNSE